MEILENVVDLYVAVYFEDYSEVKNCSISKDIKIY